MRDALHILTLSCPDRPGIVSRVTGLLFATGGNIREAAQFEDQETGRFFMRVVFTLPDTLTEALDARFQDLGQEYAMDWSLRLADTPRKVLILVSKFDHCLGDLLYRHRIQKQLSMARQDIIALIFLVHFAMHQAYEHNPQ